MESRHVTDLIDMIPSIQGSVVLRMLLEGGTTAKRFGFKSLLKKFQTFLLKLSKEYPELRSEIDKVQAEICKTKKTRK